MCTGKSYKIYKFKLIFVGGKLMCIKTYLQHEELSYNVENPAAADLNMMERRIL